MVFKNEAFFSTGRVDLILKKSRLSSTKTKIKKICAKKKRWNWEVSIPLPLECESNALPCELQSHRALSSLTLVVEEEKVSIGETLKIKLYLLCKNRHFETPNSFQTIFLLLSFSFERRQIERTFDFEEELALFSLAKKIKKQKKDSTFSRVFFLSSPLQLRRENN